METNTPNTKMCPRCGEEVDLNAQFCPKCGFAFYQQQYQQPQQPPYAPPYDPTRSDKDFLTTLLLAIFLGYLGVHRFYTNNTAIGVIQLVTLGGCGVWVLIDIIMLVTGSYKDGEGKTVKNDR